MPNKIDAIFLKIGGLTNKCKESPEFMRCTESMIKSMSDDKLTFQEVCEAGYLASVMVDQPDMWKGIKNNDVSNLR